jgi:hypothetical protein
MNVLKIEPLGPTFCIQFRLKENEIFHGRKAEVLLSLAVATARLSSVERNKTVGYRQSKKY